MILSDTTTVMSIPRRISRAREPFDARFLYGVVAVFGVLVLVTGGVSAYTDVSVPEELHESIHDELELIATGEAGRLGD